MKEVNEPNQLPDPIMVTWCFFDGAPKVAIVDLKLCIWNGGLEQDKSDLLKFNCAVLYTVFPE